MRRAVFLDRDGVINQEISYICKPEEIVLIPGAGEAIVLLNDAGFFVFIISNQSAVARNLCSLKAIDRVNARLLSLLSEKSAVIDKIYLCPHHPGGGISGGNPEYLRSCRCRKPGTGLIEQACSEYPIDLGNSFFIGDSSRDIECGKRAGMRTIRVRTGHPFTDGDEAADYTTRDLLEAAYFIVGPNSPLRKLR